MITSIIHPLGSLPLGAAGTDFGWLTELFVSQTVTQSIIVVCAVAAIGLALGSVKIRGVGMGIAGVLFIGLAFGHFGVVINPEVAHFVREFGLILFVYTIGMQVGPGFFSSLKKQGLSLNILAAGIVFGGALLAFLIVHFFGVHPAAGVGLLTGATTNTPSLGAAQETLARLQGGSAAEAVRLSGLSYAVAYPFGIIGIILAMQLFRRLFRIDLTLEERSWTQAHESNLPPLIRLNLTVKNPNLEGRSIGQIPGLASSGVVISRQLQDGKLFVATTDRIMKVGDTLLAVGLPEKVEEVRLAVGEESPLDLSNMPGDVSTRRIVVTRKGAVGKTPLELGLEQIHGVCVTRLSRAEVELPHPAAIRLHIGDTLTVVGAAAALDAVAGKLGNSMKDLNHPEIIPMFVGIGLGVILGSIPVHFPMLPSPVKLGLAGGPLIAAILLSRIGRAGPLMWYLPTNANFLLREFGIVLFLAVVGLKSGGSFVVTLTEGDGLWWIIMAAAITFLPLLAAGLIGLLALRINYLALCGVLAGSMTDPPALAFANSLSSSEAAAVSYATVYPLTMLLRVLIAQIFVILLAG